MSGEGVSTYPRRPKAEAFSNTVDVVKRLTTREKPIHIILPTTHPKYHATAF